MKRWIISIIMCLGVAAMAQGEGPQKERQRDGCAEVREVRQANQQARREHHAQQEKEGEAFRKSLEGVAPDERWDKIIAFRTEQHRENAALHGELYKKLVAAIQACENMPPERKQEVLARIGEHYRKAVDFHEGIHKEVMAFLRELKASDGTPEEKREKWQAFHEEIKAKMKAWRGEHRPKRGEGGRKRGEGHPGKKRGGAED